MKLRTLDLFAGCGGSSYGARKAGARIVGAIDIWGLATRTYRANFPGASIFTERIENVSVRALHEKIGRIDLLLASPECTNHTCARGSARRSEASRETALQVWRFAREFEPRWIVVENVVQMRKWRRYKGFISKLEALGYNVQEEVLDAKDFGVAQTRRRLFILCDRENIPSKVRAIKNGRPKPVKQILDNDGRWKARPLLTDERAENTIVRYLTGLERVGESKPFLLVYYGSDGSGGWQRLERPLRTITTVNRFALVKHERGEPKIRMLQVPELQRAMGFGTDFKLNGGSRRERIRLLGNAVCPPVVTAVIRALTRNGNASPNSKRPTGSDHRTRPR